MITTVPALIFGDALTILHENANNHLLQKDIHS